jgi:FkbH-like protein
VTAVSEREFRETLNALGLNPERVEWDSIRHFNLVMELEARWGARIPMEDVENLKTFHDFYFRLPCRPAKVLAVDADNTLWKGIVSEDGADAVVPYVGFQRGLKELRARGVMLALLSKNDPPCGGASPIERAFARSDVPLELSDFAFVGVNWEPKAGNLLAAAKALNVGADSFVFVDDNPHERGQMKAHLPSVMTVDGVEGQIASGMEGFAEMLGAAYFADAGKTRGDILRARRPAFILPPQGMETEFSKAEYLKTLELRAEPSLATEADIPRLAQMAGKTNQFNATTIRRSAEDFRSLLSDGGKRVYVFRLSDRFGAMGIVCFVVADVAEHRITDFVMSCRAMGRTLEFFAYNHVCRELGGEMPPKMDFSATAKNSPFAAFRARIAAGDTATSVEPQG